MTTPVVTHEASVVAGVASINVGVSAGGMPVDSATVCLWKTGEEYLRIRHLPVDALADQVMVVRLDFDSEVTAE